jgi:ribosome assembly protein 1
VSEKAISQSDPRSALKAVMRSWLPLSEAVLGMAVKQLPSPAEAAPERLPHLLALDSIDAVAASHLPAATRRARCPPCSFLMRSLAEQILNAEPANDILILVSAL